jgi:hypothetical protein
MAGVITQLEIENNLTVTGEMNITNKITGNNDLKIIGNVDILSDVKIEQILDVSDNILANTIISNRNKNRYYNTVLTTNNNYIDMSGSALLIPRMYGMGPNGRIDTNEQDDIAQLGMIVYDTEKHQYLGIVEYEGKKYWSGLGGVISIDQKTRIEAYNDDDSGESWRDISGLHFFTNGSERMVIDKSGNVGIGTTYPTASFSVISNKDNEKPSGNQQIHHIGCHLGQDTSGIAYLELCDDDGGRIDFSKDNAEYSGRLFYDNINNFMSFHTNGSEKVRITNQGKVGINITNPNNALSISGEKNGTAYEFGCHLGQTSDGISYLELSNIGESGIFFIRHEQGQPNTNTLKGKISYKYDNNSTSLDFLGFWAPSHDTPIEEDNYAMRINQDGSIVLNNPYNLQHSTIWDDDPNFVPTLDVSGVIKGTYLVLDNDMETKGDITAFYSSSDKRLKTNIETIDNSLDILKNIRGVRFNWNENAKNINNNVNLDKKEMGVIAQEIEPLIPEVIKKGISGYKAVRYEKIVPLLIECIKEQQSQINNQHKEIELIKAQLREILK